MENESLTPEIIIDMIKIVSSVFILRKYVRISQVNPDHEIFSSTRFLEVLAEMVDVQLDKFELEYPDIVIGIMNFKVPGEPDIQGLKD